MVAVVWKTVGVPQIVPLFVPKLRPFGNVSLISHDVIVPEPVKVGASGKSVLISFLVSVKSSGEYKSVGNSSTTVILR